MTSIQDYGLQRLERLILGLAYAPMSREAIVASYHELTEGWASFSCSEPPPWPSCVCDDHSPIEYSIGVCGIPEFRILVEPLSASPSSRANAELTRRLLDRLEERGAVDLTRMREVWDLFVPPEPQGAFSVWLAVVFAGTRPPAYKLYFNPLARGPGAAPYELVREALERLGFRDAWGLLGESLLQRGPGLDDLNYFSLDLSASLGGRVKVYALHRKATMDTFERAARSAEDYAPGDASRFLSLVAPDARLDIRAPSTCLALLEGHAQPANATLHVPITAFTANDAVRRDRILRALDAYDLPRAPYEQALGALCAGDLAASTGLHSYVSLRREKGRPRVSVYLPTQMYSARRGA